MGQANLFNDIIQRDLNVFAAWLPITQNYTLGDYGLFSDGVFAKLGNIKEFDVSFEQSKGPDVKIDYTSSRTRVIKFAAGGEVDVIPAGAVDAKITFKFEDANSFLIKAPVINVTAIGNVQQVASKLKGTKGWKKDWKVVYEVYNAQEAVVMSTKEAGTEVTFSGNASALKELKLGNAGIEFNTNKKLALDLQGNSGVIGLGLFKLKLIGGGTKFMRGEEKPTPVEVEYIKGSRVEDDV
ncbi:MAG: hypothetical protein ACJ749_14435 [Flavisolibacter sp.]